MCLCMGSVSVSSCIYCMFMSCVHPVSVLNAAVCMTCNLLMLAEDARAAIWKEHTQAISTHTCWTCQVTHNASKSRSPLS